MPDPARVFFKEADYDGQFVRSLTASYAGSADLGEVFATARRVGPPEAVRWHAAWLASAERAESAAHGALAAGRPISARGAFLRASEYYRQAFYFIRGELDDPRLRAAYGGHVAMFEQAAALMDRPVSAVRIPYEGTTLKGWFCAADASGAARPTLVMPCGYDSTAEAGWVDAPAALARGYHVLLFEGPGQGQALYEQRLYFRPDFEHVLGPVLDWLVARPDVRADRIGLIGRSFAGYLAPRAATVEHRVAALVCDPAQPDMGRRVPGGLVGKVAGRVVGAEMRFSARRREFFQARMAAHGLTSIEAYLAELGRFTMLDRASQISCPTLVIESENDFAGGDGKILLDALTCPKQLIKLTNEEGIDGHCAGLGQVVWADAVYAWLEPILGPLEATEVA
jgi:X-Pro dipeptidyl-peptidase (S15 family)